MMDFRVPSTPPSLDFVEEERGEHRLLVVGREGGDEGGVAFFEDFGASGALAGEGSVLVEGR
jgi:hypothetical protein